MWRFNPLPLAQFLASGTPEAQAAISAIAQSLDDNGTPGSDGLSAYQLWLNAGNTGTVNDFLSSLVGAPGADGQDGAPGAPGQNGADGLSAYQIWLNAGNTGTVNDFLSSLVGAPGATGPQGAKGDKGDKGDQGDPGVGALNPFADAALLWPFSSNFVDLRQSAALSTQGTAPTLSGGNVTLSGSGNFTIAARSELQLGDSRPFTMAMRFFVPSLPFMGLAAQWATDSSWIVNSVNGQINWVLMNAANSASEIASRPLSVGWHTLICDYDGSANISLELDDEGFAAAAISGSRLGAGSIGIGAYDDGSNRMPSGSIIRWLAVWRKVLSADERAAVFGKFGKPV